MSTLYEKMRPAAGYEEVLALRESDGMKFYARFHGGFISVDCPACAEPGRGQDIFDKFGFRHERCVRCRTIFVSPRPTEEALKIYYNEFDSPKAWTKLLVSSDTDRKALQYEPRVKALTDYLASSPALKGSLAIDVGAGSGAFALALKKTGFFSEVLALDFSADCVQTCRKQGLNAELGSLDGQPANSAGFIATNDLLEHLSDPSAFIHGCHRALSPGGVLSIATPNGEGFDFQIMGKETRNIVPPEHLTYFNPQSIGTFLSRHGFVDIRVSTPGKLDVDIIRSERKKHAFELDRFITRLTESDDAIRSSFQELLADNKLSSHLLVTAKKGVSS